MKLLKAELEQIIKEEIDKLLSEAPNADRNQQVLKLNRRKQAAKNIINNVRDAIQSPKMVDDAKKELAAIEQELESLPALKQQTQGERDEESDRGIPSAADFQKMYDKNQKQKEFEKASAASAAAAAKYQASYSKPRSKAAKQNALSKRINMPLKKIQGALFKKGYAPKGVSAEQFVDGKYGGMTETAIEDLQDDLGFKGKQVDGLYGGGTHGRWRKSGFAAAKGTASAAAPVARAAKKPVKQTLKSLRDEAAQRIKFYSDAINSMRALQRKLGIEGAKEQMDTLRREATAAQKKYRDAKNATNAAQVAARAKVRAGGVDSAFEYQQAAQELAVAARDKGENSPEYKAAAQKMIAVIRAQDKDKLGGVASTPSR